MKPRFLLSILMAMMIICVYGQRPTMTLTFTADENGQHVPLNSILIENLTREVDTILYAPDTLLVVDYLVGVLEINNAEGKAFNVAQNYPNPIDCKTTIDLSLPKTDNVLIIISDMLGRELLNQNFRLERGNHSFTFYPGLESLYFLTVRTDHHSQTIKMINTPAQSFSPTNCTLEYKGMKSDADRYKSGNEETNFVYYLGDLLKFTAFADIGERVITDSPTDHQNYVFYFAGVPCLDAPTVTDVDGNVYRTVLIGNQCWMAENLKVGTMIIGTQEMTDNGIIEKYCYDNDTTNCDIYGGLYQWDEMMNYSISPGVQGLCPDGWHIPTDDEWTVLTGFVSKQPEYLCNNDSINIAKALAANTNWIYYSDTCSVGFNLAGNNATGFSCLPGSLRLANGNFGYSLDGDGYWWSSTRYSNSYPWSHWTVYFEKSIIRSTFIKFNGASVRCIMDSIPLGNYILNLEADPANAGILNGAGQYQAGEDVNISATANPGWEFVNWKEDDVIVSTEASFNYTMPAQNINLTANFIQAPGSFECGVGTIADVDGNIYYTVLIENQCWLKENLRTTKYRNGTPIEYPGSDNNAWLNNTSGAYAWWSNDVSWKTKYGALYNWHAVNNSNSLCPDGWHVPTDAEWTILVDYVIAQGYPNNNYNNPNGAGNALKSCRQVNSPLGGDCNTSEHPRWISNSVHHGFDIFGFTALPGGSRTSDGLYFVLGNNGYWWSSTELSNIDAWGRLMGSSIGSIERYNHFKKGGGSSVRCLRDDE